MEDWDDVYVRAHGICCTKVRSPAIDKGLDSKVLDDDWQQGLDMRQHLRWIMEANVEGM